MNEKIERGFKPPSKPSPRDAFEQRARARLEAICEDSSDPNEWVGRIMPELGSLLRHLDPKLLSQPEKEELLTALEGCSRLTEKEEFIREVMLRLDSIFDLQGAHPAQLEEARAHAMLEVGGFTSLNRLVAYGRSGSVVHLHHTPGTTVPYKRSLYLDGMKKLARIVHDDPEIKEITATSWIVGKNPGIFSAAGFKIEEVPEDLRQEHFAGEKREIKSASIRREEFLQRFYES